MIIGVNKHQVGFQRADLLFVILCVANDNYDIAFGSMSSGGSVEADDAGTTSACNSVGFQPCPVIDIDHLDFFVSINVGGIQQILVDSNAANIVKVGLG